MKKKLIVPPIPVESAEFKTDTAGAYGKGCHGCKKTGSWMMLAFGFYNEDNERGPMFHDVFLDKEQTLHLRDRLNEAIKYNEEEEADD